MRGALVLWVVLVGTPGCFDDPAVVYPTRAPYDETQFTLGPGDKLDLTIYYGPNATKATYTLDGAGEMDVQFIGLVNAGGKTKRTVQDEIQRRLADGYLRDPIVSLTVVEINSLKCSVIGQVLKSGDVKFTPGMMITEVIAQSGGFSPMARKNMVKVTRGGATYKIPVEMIADGKRPNFPMMPGDVVFVPERPW